MQEEPNQLNRDQLEMERALSGLAPARPALDRDRFMFESGRRSAARGKALWQSLAAVMSTVAIGLAVLDRPGTPGMTPEELAATRGPMKTQNGSRTEGTNDRPAAPAKRVVDQEKVQQAAHYFELRKAVLANGLAALPEEEAIPHDEERIITAGAWMRRQEDQTRFEL